MTLEQKAKDYIIQSKHREILKQWTIQAKLVQQFPCNYRPSLLELSDKFLKQQDNKVI